MPYDVLDISNYIIKYCLEKGIPVTNLKLQKLLYFVSGSYLVYSNGEALFKEEFRAWQFGPVVPEVYFEYKMHGGSPILPRYNEEQIEEQINDSDKKFIDEILDQVGKFSAWQLVQITHKEGAPWHEAYAREVRSKIPNDIIKNYFEKHYLVTDS